MQVADIKIGFEPLPNHFVENHKTIIHCNLLVYSGLFFTLNPQHRSLLIRFIEKKPP